GPSEPGLAPKTTDPPVWSNAWHNKVLCKKLGYPSTHLLELSMRKAAYKGKDVVCIIGVGYEVAKF
ncbi:hypothetical protein FRC12_016248, partial [Ceratobasidium sp. 428]